MNFKYVGTLKSGKHTVLALDKTFEKGDEVPLTQQNVDNFAHRFDNIRVASVPEVEPPADDPPADEPPKTSAKKPPADEPPADEPPKVSTKKPPAKK